MDGVLGKERSWDESRGGGDWGLKMCEKGTEIGKCIHKKRVRVGVRKREGVRERERRARA